MEQVTNGFLPKAKPDRAGNRGLCRLRAGSGSLDPVPEGLQKTKTTLEEGAEGARAQGQ